jgi:predicted carbohydrate-binding protein with CBM5 and CBM33 domain
MPVLFLPRLSATLVTLLPIIVHGHGYLKTPRSRNYVAYMDGVSWGGTELTPEVEYNYVG